MLAAEDNAVNRLVLQTLLGGIGAETVLVEDGLQAVEAWRQGGWDVILMDVQMPQMDGLTATREIRAEEVLRNLPRTPIIALSADAMAHHVAECRAAGMDGHVGKPFELAHLVAVIASHCAPCGAAQDDMAQAQG